MNGATLGTVRTEPAVFQRSETGNSNRNDQDWVLLRDTEELWKCRIGAILAKDVTFSRRIELYSALIDRVELDTCMINGGIFFAVGAIDDEPSFREAHKWLVDANWGQDGEATKIGHDCIITNSEVDGPLVLSNLACAGTVRLNNSLIRADVRAVLHPEGDSRVKKPAYTARFAALEMQTVICTGDVDLSALELRENKTEDSSWPKRSGRLEARDLAVDGELRFTRDSTHFNATQGVDLSGAKLGRLVISSNGTGPKRFGTNWTIDGFTVKHWGVEPGGDDPKTEYEAVKSFLRGARFSPRAYLDYEGLLVGARRLKHADRIYQWMRWRVVREKTRRAGAIAISLSIGTVLGVFLVLGLAFGWPQAFIILISVILVLSAIHLVWGLLLGFGTAIKRPVAMFVVLLLTAYSVLRYAPDIQPSLQRISATPASGRSTIKEMKCDQPEQWGFTDQLFLTLHYAVPVVNIVHPSEWEPREVSCKLDCPPPRDKADSQRVSRNTLDRLLDRLVGPIRGVFLTWLGWSQSDVANYVQLFNWFLLPLFFAGLVGRIQRRREKG